ncbi:MAG: hypothetical protein KKD07_01930 [Candidatus Omnitrophica bacterium]|nr:hypothetical protein [Candidatus Omnitrophota bacterium]MBU1995789.1 hypothetical protein [Candidatus Omnitrophota bacterium]MBU4333180.1 hypothetical protein [Candidatus Omnitrophota bacterium]
MIIDIESIRKHIEDNYFEFGANKTQEVLRLVFEISKREQISYNDIFDAAPKNGKEGSHRFMHLKQYLLERRFPGFSKEERSKHGLFKELSIDPENKALIKKNERIIPKQFFIEESVLETALVDRLRKKFKNAKFNNISTYKDFVKNREFCLKDFNNRLDEFYIVRENYDFFLECPCSNDSVPCGYNTMNLGIGCGFDCTYCFLQGYINSPGILIQANIEDYFARFKKIGKDIRVGTGQFTDSLVFDHITEYSPLIVEFFRNYPKSTFEFKTKSDNVDLLIALTPPENIQVSWTLNPQTIIDNVEFGTNSLEERLRAAVRCVEAGYKVGFHFDPIIVYDRWQENYNFVVNRLFDLIDEKRIGWISLGVLRMTAKLKQVIENRFPRTNILDGEFLIGYDEKLRYSERQRNNIYSTMKQFIRERSKSVDLYLCMEDEGICSVCDINTKDMQRL